MRLLKAWFRKIRVKVLLAAEYVRQRFKRN
jgi:hypothetical protein